MSARRVDRRASHAAAALLVALLAGSASAQSPVYRTGFTDGLASGWSSGRLFAATPGNTLLGRFHNESVTLELSNLPGHGSVVVAMDLHVIGAWTGESAKGGKPTSFTVTLDDGTLLYSSLANEGAQGAAGQRYQSFPDEPGSGASHPAGLGAYKLNALGVRDDAGKVQPDSVYRLVFTAPHTAAALKLTLSAANLPGTVGSASWAVDNAVIYAVGDGADLERVRATARDAVTRTAMGLGGAFTVPESRPASIDPHAPASFRDNGLGNPGGYEFILAPAPSPLANSGSILANAMDAESRMLLSAASLPQPQGELAMGVARELAMVPVIPSAEAAFSAASAARSRPMPARREQTVTRRVSSVVYQSRFNDAPGPQWGKKGEDGHAAAPRGERFAGPFSNEAATLKLSDLPEHDQLVIDADFYTIGDWPGAAANPSRFVIEVDGRPVLAETFATENGTQRRTQSYPGSGVVGQAGRQRLPGTEASAVDSLGFAPVGDRAKGAVGDATYRLRFVVPHAKSDGTLRFAASGLPAGKGSWGLDNITVVAGGDKAMSFGDATGVMPDDDATDGTYMNPFVREPGEEWNVTGVETSPSGEMFLGPMKNQTASLTVKNFPPHTHISVASDVVVMGDWQGNTPDPSRFSITLSDGSEVFATSFATDNGAPDATQDYPGNGPAKNLPGAGAFSVGAMGYTDPVSKAPRDAVYRLHFLIPHTNANETISFTAKGLRPGASWGLDNVCVSSSDSANAGSGGGTALGDAGDLATAYPSGGSLGDGRGMAPLGDNPYIPNNPPTDYPNVPGGPGGGGGGGGGTPTGTEPTLPAPGTVPALIVGLMVASKRRRRG